jgi:Fe-S-cluster-containing dehydrogenase component
MFKTKDGITMHNDERCIGCRACQEACPYSQEEVKGDASTGQYSVISYTGEEGEPAHAMYADRTVTIKGCTMSGASMAVVAGANPPHRTRYTHPEYKDVRRSNITEKCYFCDHRIKKGKLPYCVVSCPANARIFGDKDDPNSDVAKLLKKHKSFVLKPDEGTSPNVFYINDYSV